MLPISGPFVEVIDGPSTWGKPKFRRQKDRYRQKLPYDLPLPFRFGLGVRTGKTQWGEGFGPNFRVPDFSGSTSYYWGPQAVITEAWKNVADYGIAINRAREDFREKISGRAELLVNALERVESLDMISKRAIQIYRFTRSLARFKFREASKALGIDHRKVKTNRLRRSVHAFADNVLEYQFGWAPLVSDISSAVNLLANGFSPGQVVGRGASFSPRRDNSNTPSSLPNYTFRGIASENQRCFCRFGATVRIDNPTLALASALGITDVPGAIWERVPWSFVVDYFVNVGQWLSQLSDFQGMTLVDPYYTVTRKRDVAEYVTAYKKPTGAQCGGSGVSYSTTYVQRFLGVPSVTLRKKGFTMPVARAATSISLLVKKGIKRS